MGAGGLMTMTFAIVGDVVSPRQRGRYIGLLAGVWAFASVIGPLIGGFIVDNLSWRWVFLINLPGWCGRPTGDVERATSAGRTSAALDRCRGGVPAGGWRQRSTAGVGVGRHGVSVVLTGHRRAGRRWCGAADRVRALGKPRTSAASPAASVSQPDLLRELGVGLPDRSGAVRGRDLSPAVPAGRHRCLGDQLRLAAASNDRRCRDRIRWVGTDHHANGPVPNLADRRVGDGDRRDVSVDVDASRDTSATQLALYGDTRTRRRCHDAGDDPGRPECRRLS